MALTITEKFKYSAGGRKFCYISILHDQTTSQFTAASVDMTCIESVYNLGRYAASEPANTSVLCYHMRTTAIAEGTIVDIGLPMEIGSKTHLLLIGW